MHKYQILFFFLFCSLSKIVFAQDSSRVQLGVYGGVGIPIVENGYKPTIYYNGGVSLIIHNKKKPKLRLETFVQFLEHRYMSQKINGTYEINENNIVKKVPAYVETKYKIQLLNVGVKWHLPIVYRPKFRFYFTPGIFIGSLLEFSYNGSWYDDVSKNVLYYSQNNESYPTSRITLGPSISFKSEFKLTKRMYLHTNLSLNANLLADYDGPSNIWIGFSIQPGLYWYL